MTGVAHTTNRRHPPFLRRPAPREGPLVSPAGRPSLIQLLVEERMKLLMSQGDVAPLVGSSPHFAIQLIRAPAGTRIAPAHARPRCLLYRLMSAFVLPSCDET